MDADNIIMIIVWGVFLAAYVFARIRKTGHDSRPRHRVIERKRPQSGSPRAEANPDIRIITEFNPEPKAEAHMPVSAQQPPEGERVTSSRPMQPLQRVRSHQGEKARSMLHDKQSLKRAIILGQILEPKF